MKFHIFLLVLTTMIWGAGFIAIKWTLTDFEPLWSHSIRFSFAAIIILPYLIYKLRFKSFEFFKAPLWCSLILFLALLTQTIGLKYTTAAKSGFLTTFYALFTPIILMLTQKDRYQFSFWALLCVALVGIAFLCDLDFEKFNIGDWWSLASALMLALHIIVMDRIAKDYDAIIINGLQCLLGAIISIPVAYFLSGPVDLNILLEPKQMTMGSSLMGFLFLGLFSSNVAFTLQAYTQKFISPHIVSIVFLMESIFAAFFGYLFLQEKISPLALIGCVLVLFSVGMIPKFGKKVKVITI